MLERGFTLGENRIDIGHAVRRERRALAGQIALLDTVGGVGGLAVVGIGGFGHHTSIRD